VGRSKPVSITIFLSIWYDLIRDRIPSQTAIEPIPLPPWVSVPVANSVFDVEAVVQSG
jgi:hypothetical protein